MVASACASAPKPPPSPSPTSPRAAPTTAKETATTCEATPSDLLGKVLEALDAKDFAALGALVDPARGLTLGAAGEPLSPPFALRAEQIRDEAALPNIPYTDPHDDQDEQVQLSFADYSARHLVGFQRAPLVGHDQLVHTDDLAGEGFERDAITATFGAAHFAQVVWPLGDAEQSGEWKSLVLVFGEACGCATLVGLLPNEWAP